MIPSLKSKARQSSLIALTLLSLNVAVVGADSATNRPAATVAADIVELSMSDPARWVMDTVHLGTKQVKITYDAADQAAVMTPTWSPSDRGSDDVGVRNIENGRLQLYQLVDAKDCSQAVSGFEISMPQEYVGEGKLELVFALQAGAKGDYLFNGRTFTMADFAGNGSKYKKFIVSAPDYHEPLEKLRAIERISFIFERKGSTISAPVKIRHVAIDLNTEKITPPAKVVHVKNPKSFYEFTYTTQANVDGLTARVSAESMDITRRINDAKDGVALIPQWKAGQIPAGHSGSVTLVQPLGAINDFERFEAEYVLNIPKAYFDEGKLDLWIFIQAGETGYHRWSGTPRPLTAFAEKAGQDVVLKVTEKDFRQGKQRNQIEMMGLQLNRNGSTVTEPIMLKRITVKLPVDDQPQKATNAAARASAEMLVNGNFAAGMTNWVVAESGATGKAEVVAEGPEGKAALRLKVLTVGDQPWKLQVYQTGMRVEQGREYVLTLWAKSDRAGDITVNCQQNHEPWEHHTQLKTPVTTTWQPVRFAFVAPWTDDKIRISFTDLGTAPGQVYWFANCSLVPTTKTNASAASAPAAAKPVISLNQPIGDYSSPVAAHGALQVIGNHVCDAHGKPYQLRGMSLYWSHWSGRFYTSETVNTLAEDWRCSVVRAATGAEPGEGGYLDNPTAALAKVKTVVDAAIAKGIYVIIDWHKEHRVAAPSQVAEATAFFTQMATIYGAYPNVIFEIYNEPNGPQWPAVKAYAEAVIGAIRKTGSTNLIVVGTPKWSQDVDIAAADPITDFKNIAYALHFYAGTPDHKPLRGKATAAMKKGIALFVTEWGTCNSSGNGGLDFDESVVWLNFLKQNSISWANWSLHDKVETASALKPGARVTGTPSASDLTPSGVFVYNSLVAP